MKINLKKINVIRISRNGGYTNITFEGKTVRLVNLFKYLGSLVTCNGSCMEEIGSRIFMV